jgi:predicted NAD/FAD-dependent oxidoreductase
LAVNKAIEQPLYEAFTTVLQQGLQLADKSQLQLEAPISLQGHRWGAAFPASFVPGSENTGGRAYVDSERHLAAVGDYFTSEASARVEGAYLSGSAAARGIIDSCRADGLLPPQSEL